MDDPALMASAEAEARQLWIDALARSAGRPPGGSASKSLDADAAVAAPGVPIAPDIPPPGPAAETTT